MANEKFGIGMLKNSATGIANTAVGQGMALLFGKIHDRRQLQQQEKLQALQIQGTKELSDYNQQQQLDMWNKTNYGAQVEHIKAAGLNPAMLYGHSGGGGATTGGTTSAISGGQAANAAATMQAQTGMAMQIAQTDLLKAQAKKANIEADKLEGIDTQHTLTLIEKAKADINSTKAHKILTDAQTEFQKAQTKFENDATEDKLSTIRWTAVKLRHDANVSFNQSTISQATQQTIIRTINAQLLQQELSIKLTAAQIGKTKTEINAISEKIAQDWKNLQIQQQNADQQTRANNIRAFEATIKERYPSIMNLAGATLKDFSDALNNTLGLSGFKDRTNEEAKRY